jgi:hypothetical protein
MGINIRWFKTIEFKVDNRRLTVVDRPFVEIPVNDLLRCRATAKSVQNCPK